MNQLVVMILRLYLLLNFFFCGIVYSQQAFLLKVKGGFRYVNENGQWVSLLIPTNLYIREQLRNGWFVTYNEDDYWHCGLMDQSGRTILPPEYNYEIDIETGYLNGQNFIICAKSENHYLNRGLVDTNGTQLLPFEYMGLEYDHDYWSYRKWDGESGIMDANFNVILKDFHLDFQLYDHLIVANNRDTSYLYNYAGQKILPDRFQKIKPYFDGHFFIFERNERYGLMNAEGSIIHEATLLKEPIFNQQGTALTKELPYDLNIIDTTGKMLINPMKNGYFDYPDGWIRINRSNFALRSLNNWGIADPYGNIIVPFAYDDFLADSNSFQHDLYIFSKDKLYGLVNAKNQVLFDPIYDSIWVDRKGRIYVKKDAKIGLYDQAGKCLLPMEYDQIGPFENYGCKIQKDGKWGLLNKRGGIWAIPQYDWIVDYCERAAVVVVNHQYVLIDSTGKNLTPLYDAWINLPYYSCMGNSFVYFVEEELPDLIDPYEQGRLLVMDSSGKSIPVSSFRFVMDIGNYFLVNKTEDYGDGYDPYYEGGLMDKQGKLILAPKKKTFISTVFPNGSFIVTTLNGHFYYSPNGEKKKLK